jgi:hypothetical protein
MRFMILVKATRDSEAGKQPTESLFAEMAAYHEALVKAGVLLDGAGLKPSSDGWRIRLLGREAHGRRRPVRRSQGARRRLHLDTDEDAGGGFRVGAAFSESVERPR